MVIILIQLNFLLIISLVYLHLFLHFNLIQSFKCRDWPCIPFVRVPFHIREVITLPRYLSLMHPWILYRYAKVSSCPIWLIRVPLLYILIIPQSLWEHISKQSCWHYIFEFLFTGLCIFVLFRMCLFNLLSNRSFFDRVKILVLSWLLIFFLGILVYNFKQDLKGANFFAYFTFYL